MSAQSLGFSVSRRAGGLALSLLLLAGAAAHADTWRATYSVSLLGLPIGSATTTGEFSHNSYRIEANAKMTGLGTMVSNGKGAATGAGAIAAGHILPATYAITAATSNMTRTMRMSLAGSAVTAVDISPPFEDKPDRIPVKDQDKRGVVDPVGALRSRFRGAELLGRLPAACNRTIPVFDGYTRFDVRLAYVGQRRVATTGYAGPVAVCAVRYVPIAGHRPDRPGTKFMAENKNMETLAGY